ncbi:MAG: PIN domain-containing protein [Thermoplasmata archaeon]|nr:PIN domain-containing protein [Thermoplasmata archaeon]
MPRSRRNILLDTNVFVAAVKDPKKQSDTLRLILHMIESEDIQLVGHELLVEEMVRYAEEFGSETASWILGALLGKMRLVPVSENLVRLCRNYIETPDLADVIHAAACLKSDAVLVTNDKHFDRVKDEGIVEVWSISEAIEKLL